MDAAACKFVLHVTGEAIATHEYGDIERITNWSVADSVTHAWIKLVRRSGYKGIRLHDARHSHASLLLKAGVHPKIVQERLGYSKIATTLDQYSHVAPGLQAAAAVRFDGFLTKQAPTLDASSRDVLPAAP